MGGKSPSIPVAPAPPPPPPPMPVPDDAQIKIQERKKAARRIASSGRQSTLLNEGGTLGGG